jgi:hypothetical protein
VLRLNIEQTYARLNLEIQDPFLQIKTTKPQIQLETEAAKVEISQPRGELSIDQYPSRASYGYKDIYDRTREAAERGRQTVLENIARIVEEGNRMGRIESGENAIIEIVIDRVFENAAVPEVGITPIAKSDIRFTPRSPSFKVTPGHVELDLQRGTVDVELQRGTVKGTVSPYNSIRMWTTGNQVDMEA